MKSVPSNKMMAKNCQDYDGQSCRPALDISNIDDYIMQVANEIEYNGLADRQDKELECVHNENMMEEELKGPDLEAIRQNGIKSAIGQEEAVKGSQLCLIRCKNGSLKQVSIDIKANQLVMVYYRTSQACVKTTQYDLEVMQCLRLPFKDDEKNEEAGTCGLWSLLLLLENHRKRLVYFESEQAQRKCHEAILRHQGYFDEPWTQYTTLKIIGKGSEGTVCLVRHKKSKSIYALKIISKQMVQDTIGAQNFNEPQMMQKMFEQSPKHFVRTYDAFESAEDYYIVMEYFKEGTLIDLIKNHHDSKPLSEDIAKLILRQLAEALQELHSQNIIHRDIKLNNVLVTNDLAYSKLADLGSSVQLAYRDAKVNRNIGTPGYYAPEIL